jgi:predicted SAM-dependent methyltransferase
MSYVQYGCGHSAPEGWTNFDSSPTLRIERLPLIGRFVQKNESRFPDNVLVADIVRGLPVADGSADGVYASHVLEHLTRSDFETALQNTYRMLRSGGLFRLIVPDLEARARLYVSKLDAGQKDANDWFMLSTYLGLSNRPHSLAAKAGRLLGGSLHLWMWDFSSMEAQLRRAGFVNIRRCSLGDSEDPMFIRVEEPSRFFDASNNIDELAIQASKP